MPASFGAGIFATGFRVNENCKLDMCYNKWIMTDSWKLEAFKWLPLGSWTVDTIIGPYNDRKTSGYCKICDNYIVVPELGQHVKQHLKEYEKLEKKRKRLAVQRRKEALKLARESRKNKKERDNREKQYLEGEIDE